MLLLQIENDVIRWSYEEGDIPPIDIVAQQETETRIYATDDIHVELKFVLIVFGAVSLLVSLAACITTIVSALSQHIYLHESHVQWKYDKSIPTPVKNLHMANCDTTQS